jgi:hypothetical protein
VPPVATPRLLQAALAGLLCVALPACGTDPDKSSDTAATVTSSKHVDGLTEDEFKALCDARSGTVEVMVHCGGLATAAGFSYDVTTQELAEHTCKGANTCTGWNCVTDE